MVIGAPIPTAGMSFDDRDRLAEQLHQGANPLSRSATPPEAGGPRLGCAPRKTPHHRVAHTHTEPNPPSHNRTIHSKQQISLSPGTMMASRYGARFAPTRPTRPWRAPARPPATQGPLEARGSQGGGRTAQRHRPAGARAAPRARQPPALRSRRLRRSGFTGVPAGGSSGMLPAEEARGRAGCRQKERCV